MSLFDSLFGKGRDQEEGGGGKMEVAVCKERKIGDLVVSEMGIGTWSWGNQLLWGYNEGMDDELQQVFNLCVSKGVRLFDTGDSYGTGRLNGQSEKLLGKFMEEYARDHGGVYPNIGTKFASYPWRLTVGSMEKACDESAARLRRPVDIGQIHWSTANYFPWQERVLWESLVSLYKSGRCRAVGVSNYGPQQLRKIHAFLQENGVPLASNQIQYSLLSRSVGEEVKEVCDELGIAMIAYSPLGLGLLSGRYQSKDDLPKGPRGFVFRERIDEVAPLLQCLQDVAEQKGRTIAQVAINWCMCKDTIPIPGAKSLKQAEENLGAVGWRLTTSEVEELDLAVKKVPRELVQNIFQTR
uniref:NADP-dependent oxidoreductase domain-containing protein n=1 Tax=Hanusia phi TaxID=3032 RepID=A0A7S0NEN2_9CRYP